MIEPRTVDELVRQQRADKEALRVHLRRMPFELKMIALALMQKDRCTLLAAAGRHADEPCEHHRFSEPTREEMDRLDLYLAGGSR